MTPYRSGGPGGPRCPTCGAERSPDARVCASCGTETPGVRCPDCMTLNAIGESSCRQCGAELDLEPEPAPTRLLCPRGCGGLVAGFATGETARTPEAAFDVSECERCGGIFISNDALAALVARHRPKNLGERRPSIVPPEPDSHGVVYLPCPACNARMNRTMFGRSSGVIVDVCKAHGTWFDARELTASLAFVERGGLEAVERRERERKAEEARRAEVERRVHRFDALNRPVLPGAAQLFDPNRDASDSLAGLLDILLSL
jgi:Zn-finger nucleic acid-binding protein